MTITLLKTPEWGIRPIPDSHKKLGGFDYFILWSSLGVGLLVLSAGSFLSAASFTDALLAIVVGSAGGSMLLALAGRIGSDRGIPSLVTLRPAFGIAGSYLPALLNVMQLIGWTTFEIMIMARAADILSNSAISYFAWAGIFGMLVALLGIAGPLNVVRQWLGKFAVWIAFGTSAVIIFNLMNSPDLAQIVTSPGTGMSFFSALDLVIAMPVSWMPLVADYNRFARNGKSAMWATFIGFSVTNILFYFGGVLLGTSDVIGIILAIQTMFFGFLMLLLIVDEADNAFADVYSAAVSTQNIFSHIGQKHLVVGFTAASVLLAMVVSIQQYEIFLLMIGAIFVPLFGVVITDYYVVRRRKYSDELLYGKKGTIRLGAVFAWACGTAVALALSPLTQIFIPQLPAVGGTLPSLAVSCLIYLAITGIQKHRRQTGIATSGTLSDG
jgi:putative hydroxymethylpyrimidine transporter CytX